MIKKNERRKTQFSLQVQTFYSLNGSQMYIIILRSMSLASLIHALNLTMLKLSNRHLINTLSL